MNADPIHAETARALVEDLALKGASISAIKKQLKKNGLEDRITSFEIEQIALRTEAMKGFYPNVRGPFSLV